MVIDVKFPASQGCLIFLIGLTVFCLFNQVCTGLPLNFFYPFNTSTDRSTPKKDDGGSGRFEIATVFNFFDKAYNTVYVSNNGIISFNKEFSDRYQPQSFPINGTALVAPFWADVDIEKLPGGYVYYGEYNDLDTLRRASCDIRTHRPEYGYFTATWVFVSTWFQVGYYGAEGDGKDKRNTFQAVLIADGSLSFVMFNYNRIEWTTGKNSEGNVTTGRGGEPAQVNVHVLSCTICRHREATCARNAVPQFSQSLTQHVVGYNAECCNRSEDVPGSATEDVINLTYSSNVNLPGRQLFELSDKVFPTTPINTIKTDLLKVQPPSASMLGGERLTVEGVCLPTCCAVFQGQFVELNVTFTCVSTQWEKAECVLPAVFKIGPVTLRFTVLPNSNCDRTFCGKNFDVSTNFSIYNFIRKEPLVTREKHPKWVTGTTVAVSWKQDSQFSSNNINVAILGYKSSPPSWDVLQYCTNGTTGQFSSGFCWFKKLAINSTYNTAIVRVSEWRSSPECKSTKSLFNCTVKAIYSDIFAVNTGDAERSREWCQKWITEENKLPSLESHACPTTYTLAKNDIAHFQVDPFCDSSSNVPLDMLKPSCLYTHKVKACFRLVSPLESGGDQVCCYGEDGDLKSAEEIYGWGTRQRYHFEGSNTVPTLDNFEKDILPALHCHYLNSDDEFLKQEYDRLRPKSTTEGYTPPKPAQCAGDPHIVTLDGKKYTFNGIGEYVFMQDGQRKCVIQIRTAQAKDVDGKKQRASIIDAVVMGGVGKPSIEVTRTQGTDNVKVLVSGQLHDTSATQDIHIGGLTLSVKRNQNSIESVLIVFDKEGLSVEIEPTRYLLNVLLIVGSQLRGKLEGLLGNFNGKELDDFTTRKGTQLAPSPTDKIIHEQFGLSWAITMNESLFTYQRGMTTKDFTNLQFKPYFLDDLIGLFNETETRICGLKNKECLFDLKTTRNEEIANTTKKFVDKFQVIVDQTTPVVRCVFPHSFPNTTQNRTGLSESDTVYYTCQNSSQVLTKVCRGGKWVGENVTCDKVSQKLAASSPEPIILIVASISAAGTVFLISIITIVVYVVNRKKKQKKEADTSTEMDDLGEIQNTSMFSNEEFLKQLENITQDGSFKLPRPFLEDQSLYTEYF